MTDTQTQTPHERGIDAAKETYGTWMFKGPRNADPMDHAITAYLNAMRASQEQDWHKIDDREVLERLKYRVGKTNLEHDALRLIEALKARIEWAAMQPVAPAPDVNAELLEALQAHTVFADKIAEAADIDPSETFLTVKVMPSGREAAQRSWQDVIDTGKTTIANATKGIKP